MAETYYVKPDNSPVNDLTLNSYDAMFIANGGTANGTIINSDGAATVNDGGSANNTTVNEGGTLHLIGGAATGISVASDGRLEVNKGATATGIEAEKGATLVFDVAASTHIAGTSDGAAFQIQNGIATGFALETGVLTVSSGGTALNATLNSAGFVTVYSGGKAINAVANASGEIKVFSGGTATEATVKTGGKLTVESSGFCDDATVEMGGNLYVVSSGGTAAGTYIGTMGNLTVSKGGTAYGTTVGAGGFLTVGTKGIAEGADVNGFLNVLDGGLASNVTVNDGAVVYVQSKGTGSDVYVDYGGILEVLSDGRLKGATVAQGGSATIHADVMASNVVIDGGKVTVMSDGWAYQSGVSSNTIVRNGGRLVVSGGGYVVGAAVSAGGHVTVESDATFSSATVVAADVTALDGAFVSRLNLEAGGILNVVSGGKAEHINVSAGGVLTGILREASELKFYGGTLDLNIAGVSPDSEALVDEISFLSIMPVAEDYLCTLTVSETQAEGAYKLIEGASGFDTSKAITVKDTLGTTLGTLTVNGGSTTIGGVNYTLAVTTEDVLTVTIAGGVDLTGDLDSSYNLEAGKYASSVNILEGGKLNVYKDALASQTAINAGGSMVVSQGGSASDTTVNNGGKLYVSQGGIASKTELNDGGKLFASGSVGGATVSSGGSMFVSSGATASDINVSAGGMLWIDDGVTATGIVAANGAKLYLNVAPDTYVKGTYAESAFEMKDATLSDFTVRKDGQVSVSSGGVTSNITTLDKGYLWIYNGGVAKDTVVAGELGLQGAGAVVSGVTFQAGGHLSIYKAGGKLTGKVTFETGAGVYYSDGASATLDFDLTQTTVGADALVNDLSPVLAAPFDYTLTVDGTEAAGDYKLAEGATGFDKTITVKDTLGTTLGTLTVAGGKTTIDGKDYTLTLTGTGSLGLTLGDGGGITPDITGDLNSDFELTAGMVGSSVNILEGGRLIVDGGGSADVVTVNFGGLLYVYNGGKATQIKENGGYVGVNDGADVTFVSNSFGGYVYDSPDEWATIHSGTTGTDLTVGNDGLIYVYSGGTAVDTTVAADGNLGVDDGGKLTGKVTIETGANVTVEDGAIVDFDISALSPSNVVRLNNLSVISGTPTFTLTVGASQAEGTYNLAANASSFASDQTITVVDTLGTELGTLTVAGGTTDIGGVKYTLLLTGSNLSVTLGEAIPTDTTPPDKPIPEASSELPTNGYVTVTATFSDDSVLRECSKDGENWVEYQSSGLTFVENGKAYFRATDGAGNVSDIAVYEVTNIDKVAPTISYITPSTTAPAASVTITASFDDDVSLASTQYRIGVGAWQDYTTGVTVTENTTVYFKAVDAAGNESEVKEYEVTNIIITGDITGKEYVSSGGMASGATVKAGGSLNILNGGVARDTLINAGGKLTVVGGGKLTGSMTFEDTASVTVQQFGIVDFDISKLAPSNAALVNNLSVIQGKPTYTLTVGASQAEGTYTLAGGASSFSSSITVKDTLGTELDKFYSFNQSLIIGGMVYTLTLTDDVLAVTIAGAGGGVDLTGDLDTTSGLAAGMVGSSVNILDGGNLEVFEGGFTSQTTVNSGGDLAVSEGGVADVVTVNFGGDLYIRNGGVATLVKENGGYASVNDGATATFVPNSFGGYVYNNADDWCTIHSGTTGTDLTVGNDGKITVYDGGVASQTTVNSNGDLYVSAGGSADVVTVNFGGDLYVCNGGVATLVKENGGYVGVDDGADVTFVSNSFGGYVYNNADDWCTIHDGTTGSNLTAANKGRIYVYSGGLASDTTVNDKGIVEGNSGGLIDGVVVNSGGSLLIYNGAKLTGQMTFVAGAEVIPFVGSILDFDLTQTAPDAAALVNDLSILMGTPGYTLTVDGTQASGTYNLAGNATGFNKIISVRNTSGVDYGYLTFGGTLSTSFADYTLNLTADNTLTVNVAAKGGSDTTPPTITITPSTTAPAKSVTLTAVFDDDVAVATKEYMIDSEGVWKSYTGPVTVTENVYVSFRATDTSENGTVQGYNVTNIDSSAPEKGLAEPLNDWLFNKKDKTDPVNTALTNSVGTKLAASADPIQIYFDSTPSGTLNNFVGMVPEEGGSVTLDELDYAKVVLDHGAELSFSIDYTDAAKFTVWQLVPDKKTAGAYSSAKSIQATTLKNKDATLITGSGTKPIRLEAGSYYLSMQSTNAKKGGQNEYNVTATGTFFDDGDNSDDWTNMKTVGYGPGAEIDDLGVITDETLYLISGEWVGFGDAVDYKKFTLTQAAELSFAFSKQGADTLKFTVCQLKSTEKKGVVTYSQGWNKAATVKGKDVVGNLNDLLLEAGEYYIKIENTNAKKSNGAGYAVMVSESDFYTDCDSHANDYDSKAKAVSAAVGGYTAKLAVGALQIDGTLVADAGLDINHDGYTNFVGFGDASDIVKINAVAGDTLSLKVEATDAVSLKLYGLKNGKVTSIKSVKSKNGAATIDNFTFQEKNGAEFFVGVEATNAKKGEKAWYNVEVVSFSSAPAAALTMPEADALAMTDGPGFGQYDAAAPADVSAASALADLGGMASQQAFAALA